MCSLSWWIKESCLRCLVKVPSLYRSTRPPHLEIFRFQHFLTSGLVTRIEIYSCFSHFPPRWCSISVFAAVTTYISHFLWPFSSAVNPLFIRFSPHSVPIFFLLLTQCLKCTPSLCRLARAKTSNGRTSAAIRPAAEGGSQHHSAGSTVGHVCCEAQCDEGGGRGCSQGNRTIGK